MNRKEFIKSTLLVGGSIAMPSTLGAVASETQEKKNEPKKKLWMFLSHLDKKDIHLAIPTLAWIAEKAGIAFECYLESERNGRLFARTGSTVLGGHHHLQFNYLNAYFDVQYMIYGEANLFHSSIETFGKTILVKSDSIADIYNVALKSARIKDKGSILFATSKLYEKDGKTFEIAPYLYPEIFFGEYLAFPVEAARYVKESLGMKTMNFSSLFLADEERSELDGLQVKVKNIDGFIPGDNYHTITLRIAERWKSKAKGIAFGDPAAILSQIPRLCREKRLSLYNNKRRVETKDIVVSSYTESVTTVADDLIRLCKELGNKVIVGRQTGDGDLFYWAKAGVCMQIMDPNRPAFPIVETIPNVWFKTGKTVYDDEPDDATLEKWASQGKILSTLMFHSGEIAHNEAMLNLFDLVSYTGLKMGIGVHAARYSTCPQLWELLNVPRENGGVKYHVEPVLHSGGMGVLAECNCPVEDIINHSNQSKVLISEISLGEAVPKGFYAFMDSDLKTHQQRPVELWNAIASCGFDYIISSAAPGRNEILHENAGCVVLNQTSKTICTGSPYVRITTVEDVNESSPLVAPGWFIGTLDAPVISFNPYIWRHGSRFMDIVDRITSSRFINVTPHVIGRYASILKKKGYIR